MDQWKKPKRRDVFPGMEILPQKKEEIRVPIGIIGLGSGLHIPCFDICAPDILRPMTIILLRMKLENGSYCQK